MTNSSGNTPKCVLTKSSCLLGKSPAWDCNNQHIIAWWYVWLWMPRIVDNHLWFSIGPNPYYFVCFYYNKVFNSSTAAGNKPCMINVVSAGAQILATYGAMNMCIWVDSRHKGKCWECIFMMVAFYGNFCVCVCSTTKYDYNTILICLSSFFHYFIIRPFTQSKKINRPRAIILVLTESLKRGIETPVVL